MYHTSAPYGVMLTKHGVVCARVTCISLDDVEATARTLWRVHIAYCNDNCTSKLTFRTGGIVEIKLGGNC